MKYLVQDGVYFHLGKTVVFPVSSFHSEVLLILSHNTNKAEQPARPTITLLYLLSTAPRGCDIKAVF